MRFYGDSIEDSPYSRNSPDSISRSNCFVAELSQTLLIALPLSLSDWLIVLNVEQSRQRESFIEVRSMSDFTKSSAVSHKYSIWNFLLVAKQSRYLNLRSARLLVTLSLMQTLPAEHCFSAEHDWYACPIGKTKHLDLNKVSLIRDSVIGPDLHTLRFYSFGSHFLLDVSASGFSDQMLSQLDSLLLPKRNWVRVPAVSVSIFVNLDYVVGYSAGPVGGYILVLTTGEDVIVTANDKAAVAKIEEFGFRS
jgi:hypothetical protein